MSYWMVYMSSQHKRILRRDYIINNHLLHELEQFTIIYYARDAQNAVKSDTRHTRAGKRALVPRYVNNER